MKISLLNTKALANAGTVMTVRHPATGAPIDGVTITLLGQDSNAHAHFVRSVAGKPFTSKPLPVDADESQKQAHIAEAEATKEARAVSLLSCLVVTWTGFDDDDGNPIPCTQENVKAILSDSGNAWLRSQVEAWVYDRANFLPKPQPSSTAG